MPEELDLPRNSRVRDSILAGDLGEFYFVTDRTYQEFVDAGDVVLLAVAPWCGPCRSIAPEVEQLREQYGDKYHFGVINTDANPDTASRLSIRSIPTLHCYREGEEVGRIVGHRSVDDLERHLRENFPDIRKKRLRERFPFI